MNAIVVSSRKLSTIILLTVLVVGMPAVQLDAQKKTAKIGRSDAKKLRMLLTEALAENSKSAIKKLAAQGKKLQGRYSSESFYAALEDGPVVKTGMPKARKIGRKKKETFEEFGTVHTGFGFEWEGHRYQYAVDIPPGFKNKKPRGVLLDPGHGQGAKSDQKGKAGYLGMFRNMANQGGIGDYLVVRTEIIEQVGAGGLHKSLPEDQVIPVFNQFFRDLSSRFLIDPDRIVVTGLSQTGFWTWYLGRAQADRFAAILPMGAVTWQVDQYLDNFSNLPVVVIHGDQDKICPVAQPRKTCGAMKERGYPVTYHEIAGAAHDFKAWRRLGPALKELKGAPRSAAPKKITKRFQTKDTPWCYWIRVDDLKQEGSGKANGRPTASLSASIEGQRIEITSEGIKKMTLCLSPAQVDLDKDVVVVHNKKRIFSGKPKIDFAESLRVVVDRADWKSVPQAFIKVK